MIPCPSCKAPLALVDLEGGKCPQCGLVFQNGAIVDANGGGAGQTVDLSRLQATIDVGSATLGELLPVSPNANQTIDLSRMQQTVDSDSVDFGPVQAKAIEPGPVVSPESRNGATIDLSRMQQTIDSDSVDFGKLQRPATRNAEKATVDLSRMPPMNDSDSVEFPAGQSPRENLGATVDLSKLAKTTDSSQVFESPPRQNDSSVTGVPIARTVDSVDLPLSATDVKKTITDKRLEVTVDSIEFLPPTGTDDERLNATMDSVQFATPPRTETGTVQDRDIGRTIDSVDLGAPANKPGTVGARNFNQTVDSDNLGPAGGKPGTLPDRDVMATYDSKEVTSRDANQMDQMWRGANVEKASPRMTIKGREAQPQSNQPSLVIQARQFRETTAKEFRFSNADYDLIKVLGQGGMGVVYWARQASIDRNVAVKMLKPEMARDVAQRNKFLAEAVITGDLDHPNIVPIYDLGKNHEGALFYAMKKVQGTPWDKAIAEKTLPENLDILMKVSDAVAFAHNRSIVHRDLKPENIMLGSFGEVLVMDWGLALPFGKFEKSRSIQPSASMGGTPAYMSPEMATGPFEKIGPTSDVYLLGAILYEIVTGKPPHTGKDVMKCLFAAAKNNIQATSHTGELIDIAYKAMATKQADRYQTVQDFQQALRGYESHSTSIAMASRAADTLTAAQQADSYEQYATAVFEYQEAQKLWNENTRAAQGVPAAKLAYALSALRKGDLDLSESLLDLNDPTHADCLVQIEASKQEREAKQHRLKAARRAVRGLAAAVFLAVTIGLVAVTYQTVQVQKSRDLAVENESLAKQNAEVAVANAQEADRQKTKAIENADEAKRQQGIAVINAEKAKQQESLAKENAAVALANAQEADRQKTKAIENADEAKRQQEIAEYEAYVALIGLAAAKIEENAFGYARELLEECQPALRNWEWGRLMHQCRQSVRDYNSGAPVDAIAVSPDGSRFATGGWNGMAQVWNVADGGIVASIKHSGPYVYAVAFSPDGQLLATGGSDRGEYLRLWNATTGEPIPTKSNFQGHSNGVLSVAFSRDGTQLLTSSYDNTARLWDVATGDLIRTYLGHSWWVWSAAFSPDDRQIVTASQDGTALIWSTQTGQHGAPFMGHQGPVYSAAFSPDGKSVVTGGYDRRVLLWHPADVTPFNYQALVAGETPPPSKFQEFAGHQAAVRGVAFSRDGRLLVSCGHDNAVRVWNTETGDLVKILRGHDSWVRACAFSPDGQWTLSAGHDSFARLWNIEGYAESRVLQGKWLRGHEDSVMGVTFSPNGSHVLTASRDRTARAWETKSGKETRVFEEGHSFLASTAVFSPDGKLLFTSAVDGTTRVWDVTTGVQLLKLDKTGRAAAVAVSHDGRWLLTGGDKLPNDSWRAQLWEVASGNLVHEFTGHASEVTAAAFSPDDRYCFTGDSNGRGVLWLAESAQEVRRLQWHTSKISAAMFLSDGSRLLTASDDKTVAQWNTTKMATNPATIAVDTRLTLKHDESVLSLDVVSGRQLAITCTTSGKVTLWSIETGARLRDLPVGKTNVNSVALSRDGRQALTVHPDPEERLVRLWDVENARELLAPSGTGQPGPFLDMKVAGGLVWSASFSAQGDTVVTIGGNEAQLWDARRADSGKRAMMSFSPHAAVAAVSYSPDGKRVVTGGWDNSARIWNAETGRDELKLVGGHQSYVNSAIFSPDGQFVLTASEDKTAKLWNSQTGEVVRTFAGHTAAVHFATFSPGGDLILTTSDDRTARIWDTVSGAVMREFKGHQWGVLSGAFSADGRRILTGSDDNSAKIWDAATGQTVWSLEGHTAAVTSVAFAPDGKRALTASEDFTAKLWDAENGKEVLNLKGHTQELTSVAFSRDGRYAVSGSRDGTAIIWLTTDWAAKQLGP